MQIPANSIRFLRTAAVDGGAPCEVIRLAQYDKSMPVAAVTLTENSVKYTPPEGALLKVRMKKPDGHSVYNNALGLWNNGEVLFLFTQQMTAAFGEAFLNVEITLPDTGAVKCSDPIPVFISENAVQQKDIASSDEFLTLVEILELCKKLAAAAQEAAENAAESEAVAENSATLSESWAVGGTGTREGEDTDNSKYYAGQSSTAAQQAETSASSASASASAASSSETNAKASETASAQSAASSAADAQRAEDAADRAEAIVDGDAFMQKAVYDKNGDGKVDIAENAEQLGGVPANSFLQKTGDASNVTATFSQASTRENLTTGEKLAVSLGKLMKWFADLKTVAWSGNYNDLTNKPTAASLGAFAKTDIIPVANGGTGANTAALGRKNLGLHAFTMINTTNEQGDCTIDLKSILGGGIVYATGSLAMTTEDGGYLLFSEPAPGGINVKLLSRTGVPIKNRTFRANIVCGVSW